MSTSVDNAPSGRSSTTEPHGPIPLFDQHLKALSDSYLSFFLERKRIEETYIDALRRLHFRCRSEDVMLDSRVEPNTMRGAWGEIRDNVEREADTRAAFLETLTTDVINPLVALKDTQDRIRKRIREDLRDAIAAHTEYAENTFPKLRRSYMRKAQEVEELKAAMASAPPMSPPPVPEQINPFPFVKSNLGGPVKPVVTSPQPLRPLERRPSGSVASTRNRSPSSSTALQDLAHQGKKQLNQLMTFLDKGGSAKDALGNRSDQALRSVRAKRETEEADKEYRKAVHWLETLRLRRVKLLESGYNSLESFVRELAETVKAVLVKYTDNSSATAITQTQLCSHARRMAETISPEKDTSMVSARIPRLLAAASPKPQYYFNFNVGECRDLVFGVSLVDYATSRGLGEGDIPKLVKICIKEIDQRGLEAEGIYRVSGRHAAVAELQHKIERNESAFAFHAPSDDVYVVSSLLKLYLRELPEPVFRFPLQDRMQHTEDIDEHISNNFQVLRSKIRRLPPIHQATLKAIVEHLARVAARSDKNKMDPRNLAIVFGSVIFGEDEMPKAGDLLSVQTWKDTLMEDLITNAHTLFSSNLSPPLPPAPLGEAAPIIPYGSSHTKIATVTSSSSTSSSSGQGPEPFLVPTLPLRLTRSNGIRAVSPEDFTPQLPPRPANSIHPSLRAGPMSSLPSRQSLPPPQRSGQWLDENAAAPASASPTPSTKSSVSTSVPPSPSRHERKVPSPLPLQSPWSDRDYESSETSAALSIIALTVEDPEGSEVSLPAKDEQESSPSSATTFETSKSSGSTSSLTPAPVTPPLPPLPVEPTEPTPPLSIGTPTALPDVSSSTTP